MDIQKARELLREAEINIAKCVCDTEEPNASNAIDKISQALSLLDEPVCKTCGGSGVVSDGCGCGYCDVPLTKQPCPDCQQPPAGEFADFVAMIRRTEPSVAPLTKERWLKTMLFQACDLIESLESRLAKRGEALNRAIWELETTDRKKALAVLKRILGDEDFKELAK